MFIYDEQIKLCDVTNKHKNANENKTILKHVY